MCHDLLLTPKILPLPIHQMVMSRSQWIVNLANPSYIQLTPSFFDALSQPEPIH